jgi:hypothetical protein
MRPGIQLMPGRSLAPRNLAGNPDSNMACNTLPYKIAALERQTIPDADAQEVLERNAYRGRRRPSAIPKR